MEKDNMANRVVEAYDEGRIGEVMTMEMSIRSAIATLIAGKYLRI